MFQIKGKYQYPKHVTVYLTSSPGPVENRCQYSPKKRRTSIIEAGRERKKVHDTRGRKIRDTLASFVTYRRKQRNGDEGFNLTIDHQ